MEKYLEGVIDSQGNVAREPCACTSMIEGQVHCRHQDAESPCRAILGGCAAPPWENVWSVGGEVFNSQFFDSCLEGVLLAESKQFSLVVAVDAVAVLT